MISNKPLCCNYPEPVCIVTCPFIFWLQDHNKDYIVEFPDISPSSVTYQVSKRRGMSITRNHRRFFLSEVSGILPQPHLWYSTKEAVKALELFLDAGSTFSESLTYRYVQSAYSFEVSRLVCSYFQLLPTLFMQLQLSIGLSDRTQTRVPNKRY